MPDAIIVGSKSPTPKDKTKALNMQIGGDHYKKYKIQPIEFAIKNNLDGPQLLILKYLMRYKDKGKPIEDLDKIIHVCEILKENMED